MARSLSLSSGLTSKKEIATGNRRRWRRKPSQARDLVDAETHDPLSEIACRRWAGSTRSHFDCKNEADAIHQLGVPTTFLVTSFYWENLIYFEWDQRRASWRSLFLWEPKTTQHFSRTLAKPRAIFERGDG